MGKVSEAKVASSEGDHELINSRVEERIDEVEVEEEAMAKKMRVRSHGTVVDSSDEDGGDGGDGGHGGHAVLDEKQYSRSRRHHT